MTFDAPFKSATARVKPEWIDYNGHLNMAYYNVLFDEAIDQAFIPLGLGPDYANEQKKSYFTLEAHLHYLREIHDGTPVYVTLQMLDFDEKRTHFIQQLIHAEDGYLSATSEQINVHVDLETKRSCPFPKSVYENIAAMHEAHQVLDVPPQVGSVIGIRRKR